MNLTNDNLTIVENLQVAQQKIIDSTTTMDVVLSLLIAILSILFAYLIYKNAEKIYNFSSHDGINYFKKSFLFYFLIEVVSIILLLVELSLFFVDITNVKYTELFLISLLVLGIISLFLFWFAVSYLLYSIFWKFYKEKLITKSSKDVFLLKLLGLVGIHYILYGISFLFANWGSLVYLGIVYSLLILFIYKKTHSKKIFLQPHYLGLLLLILLSIVSNIFNSFFYEANYPIIEYIVDSFTVLVYGIIFLKLQKWTKKLI